MTASLAAVEISIRFSGRIETLKVREIRPPETAMEGETTDEREFVDEWRRFC